MKNILLNFIYKNLIKFMFLNFKKSIILFLLYSILEEIKKLFSINYIVIKYNIIIYKIFFS